MRDVAMLTRTRGIWLASLVAALALGALIGARWWGDRAAAPPAEPAPPAAQEPVAPTPEPPETPLLEIQGTKLSGTDPEGRRVWDLRAQTLAVDRLRQRVVMTSVTGEFYGGGKAQLAFTAPSAVFNVASKDVELTGGVAARTPDGRTLRAARIRYAAGEGALAAFGGVVLTQSGMSIRADELRTDPALAQPRFSGNIVVRITE